MESLSFDRRVINVVASNVPSVKVSCQVNAGLVRFSTDHLQLCDRVFPGIAVEEQSCDVAVQGAGSSPVKVVSRSITKCWMPSAIISAQGRRIQLNPNSRSAFSFKISGRTSSRIAIFSKSASQRSGAISG